MFKKPLRKLTETYVSHNVLYHSLCCVLSLSTHFIVLMQDGGVAVTRVQTASEGTNGYLSISWKGSDPVGRKLHFGFLIISCDLHILKYCL